VAASIPTRIDDDLFESARLAGAFMSRSASQQVVHWATIGRELELSGRVSARSVREVLVGRTSYDGLGPEDQAAVRAAWSSRIETLRTSLDLATKFTATGQPWAELDADGHVVIRNAPGHQVEDPVIAEARKVAAKRAKAAGTAAAKPAGRAKVERAMKNSRVAASPVGRSAPALAAEAGPKRATQAQARRRSSGQ
jgi:hypothetical protein